MTSKFSLKQVEERIQKAPREEQRRFLARLPKILQIDEEDMAWLKMSEPSFAFWDNPYDERYNDL